MLTTDSKGAIHQDMTIDSSAYALFGFGALPADHPRVVATMQAIGRSLWVKTGVGGLARYERDYYFRVSEEFDKVPGNPWIICTLWLAEWDHRHGENGVRTASGVGSLEMGGDVRDAVGRLARAGSSFEPPAALGRAATWSHAQFVTTTLNYLEKLKSVSGK